MDSNLLKNVRLRDFEIEAIQHSFKQSFLPTDQLWIFGSRANPSKRGGDIDLYIETTMDAELLNTTRLDFVTSICDKIGDQRIDVVLNTTKNSLNLAIYKIAREEGIQLV